MKKLDYASKEKREDCEKIQIGDKVMSFDQEYKPFSAIIGTVIGVDEEVAGHARFIIIASEYVSRRDESGIHDEIVVRKKINKTFYPPFNGLQMTFSDKYTNFVHKIS